MGETRIVIDGLGFPESTRWHAGRAWVCNWGAGEVLAVTVDGEREVMARVDAHALPFSIDWDPDGRLLVIDGPRRVLLRQGGDGSLEQTADLTALGTGPGNELVVDARAGPHMSTAGRGAVVRVAPDGAADQVADGLQWPNGMAVIDDGGTLVVADSHAQQLIAFDVAADGALSGRRVWAEVDTRPMGSAATPTARSGSRASPDATAFASAKAARCSTPSRSIAAALPACSVATTATRC